MDIINYCRIEKDKLRICRIPGKHPLTLNLGLPKFVITFT